MTATFLLLVGLLLAALLWSDARKASEAARSHALEACARAGVQLLDHTVALQRIALRRAASGWLNIERIYAFDYSKDGVDRERSELALRGTALQWLREPSL